MTFKFLEHNSRFCRHQTCALHEIKTLDRPTGQECLERVENSTYSKFTTRGDARGTGRVDTFVGSRSDVEEVDAHGA